LDEEEGDGEGVWMRARARSHGAEGSEGWSMSCVIGALGMSIEMSISYAYFTSRLLIRLVMNIVCTEYGK
jgi:hypothetical protein